MSTGKISHCPACAGDSGSPLAPTVSTGAGGEIPPDGYYSAIVHLDTGGEMRFYVRVLNGHPYLYSDRECRDRLLWSACRGFEPADAMQYCSVWPSKAAAELETLRTANKALLERVKRLHEAGQDAIDYIDGKHSEAGRVLDGWRKANS